jgi:hypothetical protein
MQRDISQPGRRLFFVVTQICAEFLLSLALPSPLHRSGAFSAVMHQLSALVHYFGAFYNDSVRVVPCMFLKIIHLIIWHSFGITSATRRQAAPEP